MLRKYYLQKSLCAAFCYMDTPQTTRVLRDIMEKNKIEQKELAKLSGIDRATISYHINDSRPVRDQHLLGYLRAVPVEDRSNLFAAWLRDLLSGEPSLTEQLLDSGRTRIQEEIANWSAELTPQQLSDLQWWDMMLRTDPASSEFFRMITRNQQS